MFQHPAGVSLQALGNISQIYDQRGVAGSGREASVGAFDIVPLYVDPGHTNASDDADGTSPLQPKATLQSAINSSLLAQNGVIYVSGAITESVIVPPTVVPDVAIIGVGGSIDFPTWTAATAAGTALTVRQSGWLIAGFRFEPGALGTSITLQWVPGSGYVANRTVISNNYFDGLYQGQYGITLSGAPYDVQITNNEFREYTDGASGAFAIIVTDSSNANPYMCMICDNVFWENDNHIGSLGDNKSFNLSIFKGNVFHEGLGISATRILDLRGGSQGKNIVTENTFCGDYSNTGGYYAHAGAPGMWVGNIAEDVAEAEVGDNGFTVAVPAA